ncbi:hypothetical protein [Saliphagus sp. LR7]|uniref:hypothetical protein n=1 Tax=Saliphagus sp. LR7 TaxID=2282654 RepID=UPI000DF7D2ED|nr:hypothetical protein [Saliphagus sp. LR7]
MSASERFWDLVCDHRPHLTFLLSLLVGLGAITVLGFWLADPGSPEYVIAVVNMGIVLVAFVPIGYCIRRCLRREQYAEDSSE